MNAEPSSYGYLPHLLGNGPPTRPIQKFGLTCRENQFFTNFNRELWKRISCEPNDDDLHLISNGMNQKDPFRINAATIRPPTCISARSYPDLL